jgi:hypothetical protein
VVTVTSVLIMTGLILYKQDERQLEGMGRTM